MAPLTGLPGGLWQACSTRRRQLSALLCPACYCGAVSPLYSSETPQARVATPLPSECFYLLLAVKLPPLEALLEAGTILTPPPPVVTSSA